MAVGRNIAVVAVAIAAVVICILAVLGIRWYRKRMETFSVRGAIIRQNSDPRKQSPIAGVEISAAGDIAISVVESDFSGYFVLPLRRGIKVGQPILLHFRHPDYQPVDENEHVGDTIDVVRMAPLHGEVEATLDLATVTITNVLVRYTTQITTDSNTGTGVTTFQVVNTGNVPCYDHRPCSPDGKWKAAVGSASLDAGEGNLFRNARVSCIAGPCPFTKIDHDGFSRSARTISVTERDWSDTATFLFQAEVFHPQISETIRESYPVIFGRSMNFTVPGTAEGTTIEAELDNVNIVFPLGPDPKLSWADCNVRVEKNETKDYRCELKSGYRFP